jgi:hypothetical protein
LTIAYFTAWAIAAVVGRVAVVVRKAATIYAFLPHGAVVIGGTVRHADAFARWVISCATWLLTILVCGAIGIVGARRVFYRLFGLACSAHTNSAFTVGIA